MMNKILVIVGATATGKTDVAINLAKKFNGELVACDSRQVYRGLDIGTGKIPNSKFQISKGEDSWEIDGVRIWMYDVVKLGVRFSVKDYIDQATKVAEDITQRGKLPIIVGGTGLYLHGLLEGIDNLEISVDQSLRVELNQLSVNQLQEKLRQVDDQAWQEMNQSDQNNPRRLIRKIETVGQQKSVGNRGLNRDHDILKIGLSAPREILYQRIDARARDWIDQGIVEEVQGLLAQGVDKKFIEELGLEYRCVVRFLDGQIPTPSDLITQMQTKTRQYAKRQLTWFRKERDIIWFDITEVGFFQKMVKRTSDWYN